MVSWSNHWIYFMTQPSKVVSLRYIMGYEAGKVYDAQPFDTHYRVSDPLVLTPLWWKYDETNTSPTFVLLPENYTQKDIFLILLKHGVSA